MKLPVLALIVAVLSQQIGSRSAAEIQKADPHRISGTQVFEAIKLLTSYAEIGLPLEDVIRGERTFDGTVMAATTLTFEPASKLIFAPAVGDRTDRFVFVRTLRLAGVGGTITWERAASIQRTVAPGGKAPPGELGGGEGGHGKDGPDGQPGNPGYPGRSAPTIYLVVNRIEGGPLEVDLRGQDGGDGGRGQTGGDGGFGRPGARGVALLGLCRQPPGDGGNGGRAGNGGRGGEGGRGGNGGTFVLLAPEAALEKMAAMMYVDIRPGKGGEPGKGGDPGDPGLPGSPGRNEAPCAAASPGKPGEKGNEGPVGPVASDGEPGIFVKTALTDHQVRSLQLRGEVRK